MRPGVESEDTHTVFKRCIALIRNRDALTSEDGCRWLPLPGA